ncbi:MAG: DNA-processing protein DprA [Anaerolineae bacterium]|nr:DNA-processing protein DprA [Anaerolineae bacterium]MCO5206995.1 DNA-processing protein DprA [Anaerolineae bacterium]
MSDAKYWLGFNLVSGIGPAKMQALLDRFDDLEQAWNANVGALYALGIDKRTLENLVAAREALDLDAELARIERAGLRLLTWQSADYPRYLREVPMAPPVLYMRGELLSADEWAIAVVGTRRLTAYGRQVARELTLGLARSGITVISGLARGIDSLAHKTAIEAGGRTIAVLGSGLNQIYPPENRRLAEQIVAGHGALISEYALDTPPDARNFPPRNRIISGLSLGTIVVEAGERSGALITASFALEQNREVFAVPGPVTSKASKGTNRLIQEGAKLVTSIEDVLEELNLTQATQQQAVQLFMPESAEEALLLRHLVDEPTHVDELSRQSGLPTALVSSTLTLMEMKGMVQQVGGMKYVMCREDGPVYTVSADKQ